MADMLVMEQVLIALMNGNAIEAIVPPQAQTMNTHNRKVPL